MDLSRRDVSAATLAVLGASIPAGAATADRISRDNAAIHQEVVLAAPAGRIYQTLTTAKLFDHVVRASAAMNSDMKKTLGTAPTQIDARPGGAFVLFGGHITGFNLELVSDSRLVQAWRVASWKPGAYSIARVVLESRGATTQLIFDHTGFPPGEAEHLAAGWQDNYWTPLAKTLG